MTNGTRPYELDDRGVVPLVRPGGDDEMPESVSRRRPPRIREITYKGYLLRACSFERDPGMWVAEAQAFWNEGPHARIHQVFEADGERSFTIRELADERALGLAQA